MPKPGFKLKEVCPNGIALAVTEELVMNNISPILRGSCGLLLFLLLMARAEAFWMVNTLARFDGTNGKLIWGGVAKGPEGNLYGVSVNGGTNGGNFGTVFRLTPAGTLTALFSFNGTNGSWPAATLLLAHDGNLYGSTTFGGIGFNGGLTSGFGTLFRISPAGDYTPLLAFDGTNGAYPGGPLTESADGRIYGTTSDTWFMNRTNAGGHGTVFSLSTNGDFTTVYAFNGTNGDSPFGKLLQDGEFFYGTTWGGGISDLGTVFKLTTNGSLTTLVDFVGTNGVGPIAGLVYGADGQLYGTTSKGGIGYGTVYRLTTNGVFTTLHSFNEVDGDYIDGALALGQDGGLYGTSANGGRPNQGQGHIGTIFQVTTNGAVTSLLAFNNVNGTSPVAELLADDDGSFYGTTDGGGGGFGTVFRLSGGESPLIQNPELVIYDDGDRYYRWIRFQWQALAGVSYGVEFNSTLDPQGWSYDPNYGPYLIAVSPTNCVMNSMVDFPSSDPFRLGSEEQRYFRLVLMPP